MSIDLLLAGRGAGCFCIDRFDESKCQAGFASRGGQAGFKTLFA